MLSGLAAMWWSNDKGNTFKARHAHRPGTRTLRLHQHAMHTLGSGNLRLAVALPAEEDEFEWLACKTVDLFNEIALVHGMVSDFCTSHSCPRMTAGANYEYKWADPCSTKYRSPTDVSAQQYVQLLMQWVQHQLDDQAIFPTKPGVPFPPNFRDVCGNIFRRLFRVYAHVYHSHHERVVELTFEAHLNSCFVSVPRRFFLPFFSRSRTLSLRSLSSLSLSLQKHFLYFVLEFDLIKEEELKPLRPLIDKMISEDDIKWGQLKPREAVPAVAPPVPVMPPVGGDIS